MTIRSTSVLGVRLTIEERERLARLVETLTEEDIKRLAEMNEEGRPAPRRGYGGPPSPLAVVARRALLLGLKVIEDERG
jgi:hypothetical protein